MASSVCFDCLRPMDDNPWLSVHHGCLVCINCAGVHRGLGVDISFVRSLKLDTLEEKHRSLLGLGGNAKFEAFLESRGLSKEAWLAMPLSRRYASGEAELYRRRLAAEAAGESLPTDLRQGLRPPSLAQQPKRAEHWAPNKTTCDICRKRFTIARRRHHCRRCGNCVCKTCSPLSSYRPLPPIAKPCRHCLNCVPPINTSRVPSKEFI